MSRRPRNSSPGIKRDDRFGDLLMCSGVGWAGFRFPADTARIAATAETEGDDATMLEAARETHDRLLVRLEGHDSPPMVALPDFDFGIGDAYSFDELDTDINPEYVANPIPGDVYVHDTCADASKMREATGWEPEISLEEGIEQVCAPYTD